MWTIYFGFIRQQNDFVVSKVFYSIFNVIHLLYTKFVDNNTAEFTSKHKWCIPPSFTLLRNPDIGLFSPIGSNNFKEYLVWNIWGRYLEFCVVQIYKHGTNSMFREILNGTWRSRICKLLLVFLRLENEKFFRIDFWFYLYEI